MSPLPVCDPVNLTHDFTLEEMPCYREATPSDVAKLQETARQVLQPIRDQWGEVDVSSWAWWQDGCVRRSGAHGQGGTVDFVVPGAHLPDVFRWGVDQPWRNYVGRWIYEPDIPDPQHPGKLLQGEHIHVAPRADMIGAFGLSKGDSSAWIQTGFDPQTGKGTYTPVPGWGGTSGEPGRIDVEGLTVRVSGKPGTVPTWAWGGVALLVALSLRHFSQHSQE